MRKLLRKPPLFYLLSFFIPALIIFSALAGLKITPFGDNTLAISDGKSLYLNYLGYVGRAVKGQEGFLYSFTKGMGGNMMGSWGWFLLNPFFALFALFDIANYMQAYTYVSALNFCLCGLTMYCLLKDLYGHKAGNLIFSTAYALNGFLVANVFQMNFFTGVAALPLMVLGLRKILKDKNPILYVFSLAYSLLMNFYFGFMLCAASVLLFLVFFVANRDGTLNRKSVANKYIISSLLAGAVSSIVWLPALLSLRGGRLDQSIAHAITFRENMPFLDMLSKLFTGANSTAELSNGLPNVFVGILPVFLVILFFMNKKSGRKEKTAAAFLLLFYLVSFYTPVLNIAMHGGTTTNWFNYRDSFVFCFLVLMIAAGEWERFTDEPIDNTRRAAVILASIIFIVFSKSYEFVTGGAVLIDLIILALMLLARQMHIKHPEKNPKGVMAVVVLLLMCINLFLNYYFSTKNILEWEKKESEYQKVVVPVSAMVDAVKRSDSDFYRIEVGEQLSGNLGNDPMLYGYYGVGHGGSDERDFVRTGLSKLGVRRFNMRNSYGKGIPSASDSLLGLKYIISKEDLAEEKGYQKLVGIEDWAIYQNPFSLSVAVLANQEISKTELNLDDVFGNLNRTWSAMSGSDEAIFLPEDDIVFTSHNLFDPVEMTNEEAARIVREKDAAAESQSGERDTENEDSSESASESKEKEAEFLNEGSYKELPEGSSYIQYTITVHRDGPVYSYNRSGMTENNGSTVPSLIYEGYYHEGDKITRYLPVSGGVVSRSVLEDVAGRFKCAYVDTEALARQFGQVNGRPCTIERIKDSHLRGEFTAEEGQLLMLTIPYDEGWTCRIDGEEAEIKQVLGVFMAIDAPAGSHSYEMRFFPTGMKTGIGLSAAALLATLAFALVDHRRRRRVRGSVP